MNLFGLITLIAITLVEFGIVLSALRIHNDSNKGHLLGTRTAEIIWTLLPILLILALAIFSYDFAEQGQ
tara:strand:+ start:1818 stop:2024 length:207 start_codon:yes stop_codon:yes gene_type:complete